MSEKQELPADWDWVTARVECSMPKFFERLLLAAKKNVETRNTAYPDSGNKFTFHSSEPETFSVMRQAYGNQAGVRFYRVQDEIVIEGTGSGVSDLKLSGTLTLTNDGGCRLKVNGLDLDEWQVLRTALETLFFVRPTR